MKSMNNLKIFANPAACGGLTNERHKMLDRLANKLGGSLLGPDTKSAEEFMELVDRESRDGDVVVFAGGDGTLHDGLNVVHDKDVTVGYVPFGTGNAAAFAFSMIKPGPIGALSPPDEEALYEILKHCETQTIDLVKVSAPCLEKPQVAIFASVGWCAHMAGKREGPGLAGYVLPALKNVAGEFYDQNVRVSVDARKVWEDNSTFIVVSKSKYYGAGVTIVPDAKLDDGLLHTVVYKLNRVEMTALYTSSFFIGVQQRANRTARGYKVTLVSKDGPVPLQLDGDYAGQTERVTCQVVGRAIRIVTGRLEED